MTSERRDSARYRLETRLVLAGRDARRFDGAVNPPLHRATTLLIGEADALYGKAEKTYALDGMAVQEALRAAVANLEGAHDTVLAPSGLAACTLALLTVARSGGELLVTDAVYGPTRRFCDTLLSKLGVRTTYLDPRIGAGVASLLTDATCGVFLESPGSLTFEVQDAPSIAAACRARGVPVILDNTWSAGMYFKPFEHGVDLSVQALTKYQAGHADVFMGAVSAAAPEWVRRLRETSKQLGLFASPDDAYLVLRGMRTLALRLERQSASALLIAEWLASRPEVARVLHPGLATHPDHALWRRDFSGASGVFGALLHPAPAARLAAMLEGYALFGMGFSWGGYESLIVPSGSMVRTAAPWREEGELVRLSIGLEHPDDLIEDLEAGFARLRG